MLTHDPFVWPRWSWFWPYFRRLFVIAALVGALLGAVSAFWPSDSKQVFIDPIKIETALDNSNTEARLGGKP